MLCTASLEQVAYEAPPRRCGVHERPVLLVRLPVELATARVNVDLVKLDPAGTRAGVLAPLPEVADDVEEDDDEQGQVVVEEGFDTCGTSL